MRMPEQGDIIVFGRRATTTHNSSCAFASWLKGLGRPPTQEELDRMPRRCSMRWS